MGRLDLGARPDNKMFIFIYFHGDGGTTLSFALYLELITQDSLSYVIQRKRAESYHFFLTHS